MFQSDLDREQLVRKLSAFEGKAENEDEDDHLSPVVRLRQQKWTLAEVSCIVINSEFHVYLDRVLTLVILCLELFSDRGFYWNLYAEKAKHYSKG